VEARCEIVVWAAIQLELEVCLCEGLLLGVLESSPICPSRRCTLLCGVVVSQFGRIGCTGSCPQDEFWRDFPLSELCHVWLGTVQTSRHQGPKSCVGSAISVASWEWGAMWWLVFPWLSTPPVPWCGGWYIGVVENVWLIRHVQGALCKPYRWRRLARMQVKTQIRSFEPLGELARP